MIPISPYKQATISCLLRFKSANEGVGLRKLAPIRNIDPTSATSGMKVPILLQIDAVTFIAVAVGLAQDFEQTLLISTFTKDISSGSLELHPVRDC